ncbi:hypothetical protein N0V94_002275 [Neodidymelliopsis sp. IMI 364377]|nr:hypothetical protein N0V94_002275 [Neodidymelliopsis sp. IMI 364377]
MKDDLKLTFGEIFNDDTNAFLCQLIDIQKHQANREESEKWAERLRFIDISEVPDLLKQDVTKRKSHRGGPQVAPAKRKKSLVLPLLEQTDDDGQVQYVAVSWRWTREDQVPDLGYDPRVSFDYMVQRPGEKPYKSEFPDHYLERVILFAQSEKISRLWIDKECIYQRPGDGPRDRDLGVQIMDAVYGESSCSVGLLTVPLKDQSEIDLLAELLSGSIFQKIGGTGKPAYKRSRTIIAKIPQFQTLILRLLNDSRWSRGWIFQEDHLASDRMALLIPHTNNVDTKHKLYDFGMLPDNLCVELTAFRRAVTKFCMASSESESQWSIKHMLGKAKQYNIYNKQLISTPSDQWNLHGVRPWTNGHIDGQMMNTETNYNNEPIYPSSTSSILDDIFHRDLEKMHDRVAIMANAAKFSTRLDVTEQSPLVTSDGYSLSAILLALILLNGEILNTSNMMSSQTLMGYTLRQYLKIVQYKFTAPLFKQKLTFIDRCRLNPTTIQPHGVEARGFLFRLLPNRKPFPSKTKPRPLKLTVEDRENLHALAHEPDAQHVATRRKLNAVAEEVIMIVVRKLQTNYGMMYGLADFLEQHLDLDRKPPPPHKERPSTSYVLDMMATLVQALIDDRELRLACLDNEPETAQPSAIFIAPYRNDGWLSEQSTRRSGDGVGRSFVFASWDNGWTNHGMERRASIEIAPYNWKTNEALAHWDPKQAENAILKSYGWIDGLWNIKGKRTGKYTFSIPGLTSSQPVEKVSSKRKRNNDDDQSSSSKRESNDRARRELPSISSHVGD